MNGDRAAVHGAVLLAAGASRRLGHAKQLIEIDGEPLLRRAARALLATQPLECVVVLGHDAERMRAALAGWPVREVLAADHEEGLSASLRAGVAALDARCAGALVALTDQPALQVDHLLALCDAWRAQPQRAVASAYADVLGVPALLPRDLVRRRRAPARRRRCARAAAPARRRAARRAGARARCRHARRPGTAARRRTGVKLS